MQTFEYVPGWWVLRAFGRNGLVRGVDRLELLIVALGIFVVVVAAACAGALGTAVHDVRSRVYIAQAQTRHAVTAIATDEGERPMARQRDRTHQQPQLGSCRQNRRSAQDLGGR